jgi:hypothetical protein
MIAAALHRVNGQVRSSWLTIADTHRVAQACGRANGQVTPWLTGEIGNNQLLLTTIRA